MYEIRKSAQVSLALATSGACGWRLFDVVKSLSIGNETALLAFPLTVIFPTLLISILLMMPPAKSREGLFMRFGTLLQLVFILCLTKFALYLVLGFPFVFLAVELFETRLPKPLKTSLSKLVLS